MTRGGADSVPELSLQQSARALGVHWTTLQRALRKAHGRPITMRGVELRHRKNDRGEWKIALPPDALPRPAGPSADRLLGAHLAGLEQALASARAHAAAIRALTEAERIVPLDT